MNNEVQTGDLKMSVQWSVPAACYTYTCLFGCHDLDFESEAEATEAFLAHRCAS